MRYFAALSCLLLAACTSTEVKPVDASLKLKKICIERNDKVAVSDFVDTLRMGFDRHNITSEVFAKTPPASCNALLTYTALRKWDMAPFLSHAELWLRDKNGKQLGYGQFHLVGGGGFDLSKWDSTKTKMDPVIDKLLENY